MKTFTKCLVYSMVAASVAALFACSSRTSAAQDYDIRSDLELLNRNTPATAAAYERVLAHAKEQVPKLESILTYDTDPSVRFWAAKALAKAKTPSVIFCLISATKATNPQASGGAIAAIRDLVRSTPDPTVREGAYQVAVYSLMHVPPEQGYMALTILKDLRDSRCIPALAYTMEHSPVGSIATTMSEELLASLGGKEAADVLQARKKKLQDELKSLESVQVGAKPGK